jgi:hypothetical protein
MMRVDNSGCGLRERFQIDRDAHSGCPESCALVCAHYQGQCTDTPIVPGTYQHTENMSSGRRMQRVGLSRPFTVSLIGADVSCICRLRTASKADHLLPVSCTCESSSGCSP